MVDEPVRGLAAGVADRSIDGRRRLLPELEDAVAEQWVLDGVLPRLRKGAACVEVESSAVAAAAVVAGVPWPVAGLVAAVALEGRRVRVVACDQLELVRRVSGVGNLRRGILEQLRHVSGPCRWTSIKPW